MRLEQVSRFLTRWRRRTIVGVAAAAGLAMLVSGQGGGIDRQLRMVRDAIRSHAASGQVAIVEIDARSLQALDKWPWPRGHHADIIDRLREGGARTIGFDVDFSARSDPQEDAKFAAALRRGGGAVSLPTLRQSASGGSSESIDSQPIKILRDNAFLSAVAVAPDSDGYIRTMPLAISTFGVPRPALAATLAERNGEIDRHFTIDYAIDPTTIPRISAVDLIAGRVPRAAIAGRRFVVGMTALEVGDRYGVPRYGVIPGVIIQALAAETLLEGPVPSSVGGGPLLILALAVLALAVRARRKLLRPILYAAAAAAVLAVPLATEALEALSMPVAPALAAVVVAIAMAGLAAAVDRYLAKALADDATGLPNLAALALGAEASPGATVVAARIDRFATLSAGLGPEASALLVQRVAERLRFGIGGAAVYQASPGCLAWCASGEEDAQAPLDALAQLLRAPVDCGRPVDVAVTFGIASGAGRAVRRLASHAEAAAAQALAEGARWRRFDQSDSAEIDWELALLGEVDTALADGQIWVAYQPKLDIHGGAIVAAEALVRWQHPSRGAIGPDRFIPVLERAGRIGDLTRHVMRRAIADAVAWSAAGLPLGVAVNVSATLLTDADLLDWAAGLLAGNPLPPERLTIEVTETAAMDRPEEAVAALGRWRALGVGISIDDYGTGQSSLAYLQKLPATELKIDKSFVQSIATDPRNAIMVRSSIELAHQLGLKVVAEGVEDAACLAFLAELRCDTAQGYHIARPMRGDEFIAFVASRGARRAA